MKCILLIILSSMLLVNQVNAQIPVIDTANLTQTSWSALQNSLEVIQSVLQTGYMILDLTPLDEYVLGSGTFANDVVALADIVAEGNDVVQDIIDLQSQVRQLFGLESVPESTSALQIRIREMTLLVSRSYGVVLRATGLIDHALHTIEHLRAFVDQVRTLLGGLQGQQLLIQISSKQVQLQQEANVMLATMQRADALSKMQEPVILESLYRIDEHLLADHPRPKAVAR